LWEFPGGKVEEWESPHDCLKREVREELGMEIHVLSPTVFNYHEYMDRRVLLLAYNCVIESGQPETLQCEAFGWFTRDEVGKLALPPPDLFIIDRVFEEKQKG